jgi:hypothetical protein
MLPSLDTNWMGGYFQGPIMEVMSTWEGRCGVPTFCWRHRHVLNEDDYFNKVRKLEFVGKVLGEKDLGWEFGFR